MMKTYNLVGKNGVINGVTIDESAKEDFKKMMNWDEEEFNHYTKKVEPKARK